MGASPVQRHTIVPSPAFARSCSLHSFGRRRSARRASHASTVAFVALTQLWIARSWIASRPVVLLGASNPMHQTVWMRVDSEQLPLLKVTSGIIMVLLVAAVVLLCLAVVAKLRKKRGAHKVQKNLSVSFTPLVSCRFVADLTELPVACKAMFWWNEDDFGEFLKLRVRIGKAYRVAAKKMGVDVGGAYPPIPELAHESRRGLGLGRKSIRARNRDRYMTAVLDEQHRHRHCRSKPFLATGTLTDMDIEEMEALSSVAQRFSEDDRLYAHTLAQNYWEQDLRDRKKEEEMHEDGQPAAPRRVNSGLILSSSGGEDSEDDPSDSLHSPHHWFPSIASLDEDLELPREFTYSMREADDLRRSLATAAKGHGLSIDKLRQVGLTATGHHLSRAQRLHWRKSGTDPRADDGGAETTDGEFASAEGEEFRASAEDEYGTPQQYRSWRLGRVPSKPMQRIENRVISEYGTPQEYIAWRNFHTAKRRSSS